MIIVASIVVVVVVVIVVISKCLPKARRPLSLPLSPSLCAKPRFVRSVAGHFLARELKSERLYKLSAMLFSRPSSARATRRRTK